MAKLVLQPNPLFKGKVEIPCVGDSPAVIELTFKHRTKSELDEFIKTRTGVDDVDSFMDMTSNWDLKEDFNRGTVTTLLENYISAARVTFQAYMKLLIEGKTKN